ncbi:MAG: hypothetical protein JWN80_1242 [Microbacteriaceae bacterium]|jgi:hypothetical protein|nr:hypothetical protein [Microbacteriaceae bacterium]
MRFFKNLQQAGVSCALIGLGLSVVGVQINGYPPLTSVIPWTVFGVGLFALAMHSLMIVATHEISDDEETQPPAN